MTAPTPAVLTAEKIVRQRTDFARMFGLPELTFDTATLLPLLDTIDAQAAEIERLHAIVAAHRGRSAAPTDPAGTTP